jgi:hypothetical protein
MEGYGWNLLATVFAAGGLVVQVHMIKSRLDQLDAELRALRSVLYQVVGDRVAEVLEHGKKT